MRVKFSKKDYTDSGLALTLILLLAKLIFKLPVNEIWPIVILFLSMAIPAIFYPFAVLWYNFSDFLGQIMSKVILFLIYIIFVVPVAFIRKLMGKDNLKLKIFKKNNQSVFVTRNHSFSADDLKSPF